MATQGKRVRVEIHAEFLAGLREQYMRLGRESNPGPPSWDDFLSAALSIGLECLRVMSDAEVLALLESGMLA